ncbi:HD-GYP domain-containing protein [Desulforhopalus sp. 52FAK]
MIAPEFLPILFVCAGAVIMTLSIAKYYSTLTLAQKFEKGSADTFGTKWYKIHHLLMVFFLVGYILVIISLVKNINIIGELFISLIFFFGAAFVLIGILLQNKLLRSIELQQHKYIEKNEQLNQLQDANIFTLAYLAEIRDSETGKHIERTSMYVRELAIQLSILPKYKNHLTSKYVSDLVKSAPLHDIGKVGIEDAILNKAGKLTDTEFNAIKRHCEYGANILTIAESKVNFRSYLALAIPLVRSHHERWDGKGYPDGLKGDQIPLAARIMAVADVYDALRSKRCYKQAFSHEKAMGVIVKDRGTHFAPAVVDAFLKCERKFNQISLTHAD